MCEYDLKQLLSDEMLDLYYKMALNRALDGCGDIQRCLTPNCTYAYIMEEGQNIFACAICATNYCIDCKVKFHEGMSCSEWKLKQVNTNHQAAIEKLVSDLKMKKCNKCEQVILRTQGCNHMTCVCKYEFCYICGKEWHNCEHNFWDGIDQNHDVPILVDILDDEEY